VSDLRIPPGAFEVPREVLDNSRVRASALRVEKRPFLFNTDLDGILSAQLLSLVLGWEPIGMCKCAGRGSDSLWVGERHGGVHPDAACLLPQEPPESPGQPCAGRRAVSTEPRWAQGRLGESDGYPPVANRGAAYVRCWMANSPNATRFGPWGHRHVSTLMHQRWGRP
jgi:hypothetical protein